jgi:hypothetical protein
MFSAGINDPVLAAGGHETTGAFSRHLQGVQRLQMDLEAHFPVFFHRLTQSGFIGGKLFSPALVFQFLLAFHGNLQNAPSAEREAPKAMRWKKISISPTFFFIRLSTPCTKKGHLVHPPRNQLTVYHIFANSAGEVRLPA